MKGHVRHIAMCAPMFIVVGVLLATGAGVGVLVPVAACVLMMGAMMAGMGIFARRHGGH